MGAASAVYVCAVLLALALFAGDAGAKSFGGGSSRSSFGGSSFGSSKPSSGGSSWFSSSKPTTTPTVATSNSAPVKANSIDNKLAQQSATAGKTYTTKADAETAYRQKLTTQSTYTSSTPPATRPDYVPQNVNVGGHSTTVIYHSYPSGGYGYGYYDPMTHLFVNLAATQMLINANRQAEMNQMYATQQAQQAQQAQQNDAYYNQPVPVTTTSSSNVFLYLLLLILGIITVIFLVRFFF